ncbi:MULTISPECIES: MmgE/PrpD family protein [unclassified Janibacter]|uniref:MmgE/PrpD family protein n=1 Tax=unclassified Janibacter TaxID=2649294 RepID=UPI003D081A75
MSTALDLARWACDLEPTTDDLELADRQLRDTVAVALVARDEDLLRRTAALTEPARWALAAHLVDFDDLHLPSTTHISTVCVPVALATGGGARAYLAGAGVMARLGTALGWSHYSAGWHATTTAGALAAAVTAAVGLGLDAETTATAIALAVPAAGGVHGAFGTDAKSIQVSFAVEAGIRAARLAADGVEANVDVVDEWLVLVGAERDHVDLSGPAVPGGLAIKLHPCCYALQRPIGAAAALRQQVGDLDDITRIVVRTPKGTITPLIHSRPSTGLEAKFSLEYSVVAALVDDYCGFATFSDEGAQRERLRDLVQRVEVDAHAEGAQQLLAGQVDITVESATGNLRSTLIDPPGSPANPPTREQLEDKLIECLAGTGIGISDITWSASTALLAAHLPTPTQGAAAS